VRTVIGRREWRRLEGEIGSRRAWPMLPKYVVVEVELEAGSMYVGLYNLGGAPIYSVIARSRVWVLRAVVKSRMGAVAI
jgi:hypothetical protein